MSTAVWTKSTGSAENRHTNTADERAAARVTRAETLASRPLLEYRSLVGGHRKWCNPYFGGETRAGV